MDNSRHLFWDQASETADWPRRREQQEQRFLATWRHASAHSRAYQKIAGEAGLEAGDLKGLEDLPKLPLLRMSHILEAQRSEPPFGGFQTLEPQQIRRIYINGRIWQPGEWDYDDVSWAKALKGAGFAPGDVALNTFSYHLWPYAFMLDESLKMIGATTVPTGVGNTLMQVQIMQTLGANAFLGTPSFLMTLAQRAEGMGLEVRRDLKLRKAMVGAEMLPESLRRRLENNLQISIRQAYGTVLSGCLGFECNALSGLHVPDEVVLEVVDPASGQPVPEGSAGEIVATNFCLSFPMIRLATGDLSYLVANQCPCGRTGPLLGKVLGRVDQAVKVRGTFIHPWQTDEVLARYHEVFKYQVIITRLEYRDQMTIRVELSEEGAEEGKLARRIQRDIKDLINVEGLVEVVARGTIPDFYKKIEDRRHWE